MPENNLFLITFSKPYEFEGEKYESIDLKEIENVTAAQLSNVEEQVAALVPELSMDYALLLAAKVTGKPYSFFQSLPGKEGLKVKRTVQGFLNN